MGSDTDRIYARYQTWFNWAVILRTLHYTLGMLIIIASVLTGFLPKGSTWQIVASVNTAICGAVVSFVNPARLGAGYLRAWRYADSAIRRYESAADAEKQKELKLVNDALDEGERMIGIAESATTDEKTRMAKVTKR